MSLSKISKPNDRPSIITVLGEAGRGKTTLAATFPNPVFIRAEDGLQAVPVDSRPDAFPVIDKVEQLWEQLKALINEEHEYKTVVIDSVTKLEQLFIQHIVDTDPKKPKSINAAMGGYGAGLAAVAALHNRVRKAVGILNSQKNMFVVFIAHADTETIDMPDSEPYSRYSLRLGKKSIAPYVDDVDIVGLIRLRSFVKQGDNDKNKIITDGSRVISMVATESSVQKNRLGITEDLEVEQGVNPFINYIPSLKTGQ